MDFDRIQRMCEHLAPEGIAERIGELRDHPDHDTDIQNRDVFRGEWNAALDRAQDQLHIRQAVEDALRKKAQKIPPASGS